MHREYIKENVVEVLKKHRGKENAIKSKVLFCLATGEAIIPAKAQSQTRVIRSVIRELREKRELPVMSGDKGYWIAESDEELRDYVERSLIEAKRMMKLGSQLSGIPVDRMVEQLKLKLNENEQETLNEQETQHHAV